jgi:hypothetical protein
MEAWMHFDAMLYDVFQQPGASPSPFGSTTLGWLYEVSDADLRRLSCRHPPKARQPRPPVARWSHRRRAGSGLPHPCRADA